MMMMNGSHRHHHHSVIASSLSAGVVLLLLLLFSSSLMVVSGSSSSSSLSQSSTSTSTTSRTSHHRRRAASTTGGMYECGEVITTTTKDEINAIAEFYVNILFSGDNAANIGFKDLATMTLFANIKYDIQVVKLCMSCKEAKEESDTLLSDYNIDGDDRYSFSKYCNENEYGYDAIHSTLGFFPIDPLTNEIFQDVNLRTVINGHQTLAGDVVEFTPTNTWEENWIDFLSNNSVTNPSYVFLKTVDFIVTSVASGSGAIGLTPDYLGFGESSNYNRTYFGEENYCQSFVLGFLAAKKYLAETSPCTGMDDVVTTAGYSEGGYSSTVGAFAFRQLGIDVWGHYPGSTPMNPSIQFSYIFDLFADGTIPEDDPSTLLGMKVILPIVGYSYSNEFPFLPNTGSGQNVLTEEYITQTQQWFNAPATITDISYIDDIPDVVTDIINPDMIAMFEAAKQANVMDPCPDFATEGSTDKICEALQEGNLWTELDSDRTDFSVTYCHSPDDNIVTIDNVPSSFTNDNIAIYSGILPFLNPTGDHTAASVLCAISPLVVFSTVSKDGPISMSDLEVSCTEPPTSAPTRKSDAGSKGPGKSGGSTKIGSLMVLLPVSILVALTMQMAAFV